MGIQNAITIQHGQKEGNKYIHVETAISKRCSNAEYAFYLFRNGVKVETKWYSSTPDCNFGIDKDGIYYAVVFIKVAEDSPSIYTSHPIQVLPLPEEAKAYPPSTISIFGSCVSRDLLEYSNNIELIYYIARQSVVSAVSASIPVCESEIPLSSAFQREQVFNDFNKLAFTLFRRKKSQYMLIDLVDERFQLAKYKDSYVTYSLECQKSGLLPEHVPFARRERYCLNNGEICYKIDGKNLDEFLDKFCDKLITLYSAKQIILHRVYGAEWYIDSSGEIHPFDNNTVGRVKHDNYLYEYMYEYIHNKFKGKIYNIDISRGYYAYQEHKWGLSPIHFQKEYYRKVMNEINSYIGLQLEGSSL